MVTRMYVCMIRVVCKTHARDMAMGDFIATTREFICVTAERMASDQSWWQWNDHILLCSMLHGFSQLGTHRRIRLSGVLFHLECTWEQLMFSV